jgi:hypothetical protein
MPPARLVDNVMINQTHQREGADNEFEIEPFNSGGKDVTERYASIGLQIRPKLFLDRLSIFCSITRH